MFRAADTFHSITRFVREAETVPAYAGATPRAAFEPDDEAGTLMPVYSEIASRLSRNDYTRHTAR